MLCQSAAAYVLQLLWLDGSLSTEVADGIVIVDAAVVCQRHACTSQDLGLLLCEPLNQAVKLQPGCSHAEPILEGHTMRFAK